MNQGANVHDVDALKSLHAALAKFGVQAQGALDSAKSELRRATDFLARQTAFWQKELLRRQEELNRARADLSRHRWMHDGERVGGSDKEIALHRAREMLREAEAKVEIVRRWKRLLPEAVADYDGPAHVFAGTLEADLRLGLEVLEGRAAALEAYLALRGPEK